MKRLLLTSVLLLTLLLPVSGLALDSTGVTPVNVTVASKAVPVGAVIPWSGGTPPSDYLECNGQVINASLYPELRNKIGSRVPDLRGEMIRGWDHGRGVDSGRSLLSSQAAAQPKVQVVTGIEFGPGQVWKKIGRKGGTSHGNEEDIYGWVDLPTKEILVPGGSSDMHPSNVAMMYIIKAR